MVYGAKSNSHDYGEHFKKSTFKNGGCKKNSCIFVTKLKLQKRLSMQLLNRYTLRMLLNLGMRLKLSSARLNGRKNKKIMFAKNVRFDLLSFT